jgi:hypothetical protein
MARFADDLKLAKLPPFPHRQQSVPRHTTRMTTDIARAAGSQSCRHMTSRSGAT